MSILLLILFLISAFVYFHQAVIVRSNNELSLHDLNMLQHKIDIYELINKGSTNQSIPKNIEETREYLEACKRLTGKVTFIDFALEEAHTSASEIEDFAKERRFMEISSPELTNINRTASIQLFRTVVANASLFLVVISPLIFLMLLYRFISGGSISVEKFAEKLTTKNC